LSIEFAINSLRGVGVQMIGARSLQALGLREGTAQNLVYRITQLERSGIRIAPKAYCSAVIRFSKSSEDKLLDQLLQTDIHPNEFDDTDARRRMLEDAIKAKDHNRKELLEGVERALAEDKEPHQLDAMLDQILNTRKIGKAKILLDRMEALKVSPDPRVANKLLKRIFWGVGNHPHNFKRGIKSGDPDPQLDRAIYVARRLSFHRFSMPLQNWARLLRSLGREERLEELLQLSLDVVDFFKPSRGGLIPVRSGDTPQGRRILDDNLYVNFSQRVGKADSRMSTSESQSNHQLQQEAEARFAQRQDEGIQFLPADLPFSHRQHPIQRLFSPFLQRAVVRWGFDQTLAQRPMRRPKSKSSHPTLEDFDIAKGVRILAILRDHGVLIDPQIIRSSISQRISVGQIPSRRHRQRDSTNVGTEFVKRLVDEAWGSELLPSLPELNRSVEKSEIQTRNRYPRLFSDTFNERRYDLHHHETSV
jgi:hypothetical protein